MNCKGITDAAVLWEQLFPFTGVTNKGFYSALGFPEKMIENINVEKCHHMVVLIRLSKIDLILI